jgi:hypothetical protein
MGGQLLGVGSTLQTSILAIAATRNVGHFAALQVDWGCRVVVLL